jgi:hypothetical protein
MEENMSENEILDMCMNEVAEEADSDYNPDGGEEQYGDDNQYNQQYNGNHHDNNEYQEDEYGQEEYHHDPDELDEELQPPPKPATPSKI